MSGTFGNDLILFQSFPPLVVMLTTPSSEPTIIRPSASKLSEIPIKLPYMDVETFFATESTLQTRSMTLSLFLSICCVKSGLMTFHESPLSSD